MEEIKVPNDTIVNSKGHMLAVRGGHHEIVRYLLEVARIPIEAFTYTGNSKIVMSIYYDAIVEAKAKGHVAVLQLLADRGLQLDKFKDESEYL
jgi:hypothetical protein